MKSGFNNLTPEQQRLLALRLRRRHAAQQSESRKTDIAPSEKMAPLTLGQRELWLLTHKSEESAALYNDSFALRFRGQFQTRAMREAVVSLVNRHEALRTSFDSAGKYQRICSKIEVELPLIDLSHVSASEQEKALADELRSLASAPFDLSVAPLLRARVVRLNDNDQVVSLTLHHIITDGSSNGVVLSDLADLYSANVKGVTAGLREVAQLSDLVMIGSATVTDGALEKFWTAEFADGFPGLNLPADRARPSGQTFAGALAYQTIGQSILEKITKVAQANNVTPFGMLIAAFRLLMHRLSGQQDLVVGTLSAGQLWADPTERSVGYFVNLLPLRSRPDENLPFLSYLRSTYAQLLDAFEHQGYPISLLAEKLAEKSEPKPDSARSTLTPCVFNFVISPGRLQFEGADVEMRRVHNGYSRFEVSINATRHHKGLSLEWEYNTGLFDEPTIRRWMRHFETLLGEIAEQPNLQLRQ